MGISQLNSCRFKSSIFYSIMKEQQKSELAIDVLKHRVDQVERTLVHYREIKAKVEKELEIEADNQKKHSLENSNLGIFWIQYKRTVTICREYQKNILLKESRSL